ncbi:MAG: class I SAM-dependent methyltransferase [Okeania sp. SIO2C2]|uniref:class I SAM-dependent DNA methyltransferase n=1 Tax=Okeania sp. SIO2C2 TaxID=2607787 RepID=UPI0013BC0D39|nr:class I SAM-dependent methyltransferase [Okeania sp. SIO2C2]NEP88533.1 class I SAM-dependent methyltransferase [Okeania sp. SIO2C2]
MKAQEVLKTHSDLKYQYNNDIANVFEEYLKTDYRRAAKDLFVAAVGDVAGQRVLELSCGTGPIARGLKQAYPSASIVGSDISSGMLAKAKEIEAAEPLGIQYLVGDVMTQGAVGGGNYDVVVAHCLFCYAKDKTELRNMAQTCYDNLRSGGRLVLAVNNDVWTRTSIMQPYRAGVSIFQAPISGHDPVDTQEGEQCKVNVKLPDGQTETSWHYHWEEQTCLQMLESVGFFQAKLEPFSLEIVPPSQRFDPGYTSFVDFPFSTILRARKPE